MTQFTDLGLAEPLLKALAAKDYSTPTPIQLQAIPPLLAGRDLCGIAQTGTGKTAAFALPSLHHLMNNPKPRPIKGCRMLVLSPTRELAAQIAESFRAYGRFLRMSVETVFGGVPIGRQIRALAGGVDVLVATPGRLLDLIEQRALTLKDVEIFVLDEADQMMDLGFIHAIRRVDKMLPKERQTLFFSATMPPAIAELAGRFLTDPVQVAIAPQASTAERVDQYATHVNQAEKQALLTHVIRTETIEAALIFTRTKHGADKVVRFLEGAGIKAAAIHGNKSQAQRTQALQAFRHGHIKLLVATDIAARGIDVPAVSHVINFELPNVAEQYVHRIGRTARAGRDGIAISFVAEDERAYLRGIEKLTRVRCTVTPLPQDFVALVQSLPKPAPAKPAGERGPRPHGQRPQGQRPQGQRPQGERGHGERPQRQPAHRGSGAGERAGAGGEARPFHRRKGPVGAHRGAVKRVG